MKKIFSILLKSIAWFISLLIAALAFAIIFGVTVDLSFLKPGVEKAAKSVLQREVKINGPVVFEFSRWTAIDVHNVQIENVPNATQASFFQAGLARIEIGLMPLFRGEIHIREVIAEDITLNLENDTNGAPNWVFGEKEPKAKESKVKKDKSTKKEDDNIITFGGLDKLSFKTISLTYHDAVMKKTFYAKLDSMVGSISSGKPIVLDLDGQINKTPVHMNLKGLPFNDLIAKNKLWVFELNGLINDKKVLVKGELIHGDVPKVKMAFGINNIDVGLILAKLGLVNGLSASVGNAGVEFVLKGKSLYEVLRESSMVFVLKDAAWKVNLPKSSTHFNITRLNGEIRVEKGNDVTMNLSGNLKNEPVKLKITTSPLVSYVETPDAIPLVIEAELTDMKLQFKSTLALPLSSKDLKVALNLSGNRLDSMNSLFNLKLPPVGPISLDTRMQLTDKGFDLSQLDVQVGKTNLKGKMNLDVSQKVSKLDIELISDMIQINDFDFDSKKEKEEKKKTTTETKKKELTQNEKKKIRKLLSQEVLGLVNADIKIKAKQVFSGKDKLGSASANMTLKKSRLAVEPLLVNIPGGGIKVDFFYLPAKESATVDLKVKIDKFDIGALARRAKPGTDMGGDFYLDAQLHSVTPNLKEMMKHAKGHFDFGIVPKNFSAGIIDLWAVNLVSALMDKETEKDKSQVNCFIMRFGMDEGVMQDKIVYMDTTNMIVAGEAKINFQKETIDMMMAPKAKKAEFFSLATPIKINGTFKDFGMELSMVDLVGTVISFVTSPVIVPVKRLFVEELPSDGKDACVRAWRYVKEKKSAEKTSTGHERN